jgi:hypothetical protein
MPLAVDTTLMPIVTEQIHPKRSILPPWVLVTSLTLLSFPLGLVASSLFHPVSLDMWGRRLDFGRVGAANLPPLGWYSGPNWSGAFRLPLRRDAYLIVWAPSLKSN